MGSLRRDTKRKGDASEAAVLAALVQVGYHVAIPFGENQRYDLIIEKDGVLSRVQVKSGRLRKGAILFNCYSSHAHRSGPSCRSYIGEIEYIAVYCPDVDKVYLVPIADLSVSSGSIRLGQTKNGQSKGVRWASQYEILLKLPRPVGASAEDGVPVRPEPPL
jgi:hypothetical protein